jgi:anti-sigma-K factor RskA
MNRELLEAKLAEYVDGTLPPADRAEIEATLAGDPALAEEVAAVQRTHALVRALPDEPAPAAMTDAIFAATVHRRRFRLWRLSGLADLFGPIPVAATLVVFIAVGALLFHYVAPMKKEPAKSPLILAQVDAPTEPTVAREAEKKEFAEKDVTRGPAAAGKLEEAATGLKLLPALQKDRVAGVGGGRFDDNRVADALGRDQQVVTIAPKSAGEAADAEEEMDLAGSEGQTGYASGGILAGDATEAKPAEPPPPPAAPPAAMYRAFGAASTAEQPEETKNLATERNLDETAADKGKRAKRAEVAPVIVQRWDGTYSGLTKPGAMVVTDEAAWENLWRLMHANLIEKPPTPAVDFSEYAVVGAFLGMKTTGGWAIRIVEVRVANGKLVVVVHETSPRPGDLVTMALTQPFSVVVVPREIGGADLSAVPVQLERQ